MAKTCGACEKSTQAGVTATANGVAIHCACSETGKVHPSDHQCDVPEKPRLCEVLGVDVGQRFRVRNSDGYVDGPFFIRNDGGISCPVRDIGALDLLSALIEGINRPEKIERVPRLTPEEVQRCRDFGAKWVGRQKGIMADDVPPEDILVLLFSDRPKMDEDGPVSEKEVFLGAVRPSLFPSVKPGQLVPVEDEP